MVGFAEANVPSRAIQIQVIIATLALIGVSKGLISRRERE